MPKCVKSAPPGWRCPLVFSCVPKDGAAVRFEWTLALDGPIDYWSQLYSFTSPVAAAAEAQRSRGCIVAVISAGGSVSVPCSRCLEPASCDVSGTLRSVFALRSGYGRSRADGKAERGEPDFEDDELILIDPWEKEADLAPLVWEALIMSLPSTVLCREGCKGLCPQCGANLNMGDCGCTFPKGDPRFAVLAPPGQN